MKTQCHLNPPSRKTTATALTVELTQADHLYSKTRGHGKSFFF